MRAHRLREFGLFAAAAVLLSCAADAPTSPDPSGASARGGKPRIASIVVAPGTTDLYVGETAQLTATAFTEAGEVVAGVKFRWSSSLSTTVSVSRTGLVTALATGGPVTISAQSGRLTGTAVVNVLVYTPPSGWLSLSPMLTARRNHGAAAVGNTLYVIGGFNGESSVEAYNVLTDTWTARAPLPTPRHELGSATVNGTVYAIGGQGASIFPTVEAYDPASNTWTAKAPMPTARLGLVVVAVNNIIYAIGGCSDNECSSGGELAVVEAYDPVANTWTTKASMPTARGYAAGAASNGIIYVTGGRDASSTNYINTVEAYDVATNTWTTKAVMPTGRQWHAMATLNGLVYAIAGYNGTPGVQLSSVEVYNPGTDSWSTGASIPTHRLYLSATTVGGGIYAAGGYNTVNGVESLLATLEAFAP